ncbi:MAG: riboflavin biosynthesis protein RibF [Candidatus Fraserbacteria bacterium RBG_16_55_9]|uniref:Riboflavin biosynthesis protein n=1 Tax=Fraserbacteria sp. (strain RBG_16_55_9) TaxID=1817864 RepID=A0A1F5V0G2_FRAXR|nr:MAG: riboflavin biosynthesis protein RibF [Candidatus Fraserbacteria bacterium RBG_16_55_9]
MADTRPHSAITIGTFDGIHLGHRALLQRTREIAKGHELKSLAVTFPRPPQNYLGRPKQLLMPSEKRIALLAQYVDQVVVIEFPEIQWLSPREFVTGILCERLRAAAVVVGRNFRFGRSRKGNVSTLVELGSELGLDVQIVDPVLVNGEQVSSTAIRKAIQLGDIEQATRLLGDPPQLWGKVIRGEGQGRALGFPTANLSVDPELLMPGEGIYAARVFYRNESRAGSLYIGRRPTFNGTRTSVEVHILEADSDKELYGEELAVQLFTRLRGEKRFASAEELQAQIRTDVEATREFFSRKSF